MKRKPFFKSVTLLISLAMIAVACAAPTTQAPAATEPPATEAPATEAPTEAATEAPTEAATEAPTEAATEAPATGENPYRPTELLDAVQAIKDATAGQTPPQGAKFAILTNNLSPFWTAAQQGASRASAELGVPITFQGPTASDLLSQQLTMLETFVNDEYTAITFSAIDRRRPDPLSSRQWVRASRSSAWTRTPLAPLARCTSACRTTTRAWRRPRQRLRSLARAKWLASSALPQPRTLRIASRALRTPSQAQSWKW